MSRLRIYPESGVPCPFCLTKDTLGQEDLLCTECGQRAPAEYLRYQQAAEITAIQTFGWAGHGKSTFLAALTLVLTRMGMAWPGYFCSALTEDSQRKLRELNTYLRTGGLPPVTSTEGDTILLLLKNAGVWADRLIIYRDYPGEIFDRLEVDVNRIPLLHRAPVTLLLLSPNDLSSVAGGRSMEMLMGSLVNALNQKGVDFERDRRCAVLVLTKADAIAHLPTLVRNYLKQDRLWSAIHRGMNDGPSHLQSSERELSEEPGSEEYRERMAAAGDAIREWIEKDPAGRSLVRIAEGHGITLRFSAVSATGSQPDENGFLSAPWHPRRVIDPLLWALEFDPRRLSLLDRGFERFFGRRGVRLED